MVTFAVVFYILFDCWGFAFVDACGLNDLFASAWVWVAVVGWVCVFACMVV